MRGRRLRLPWSGTRARWASRYRPKLRCRSARLGRRLLGGGANLSRLGPARLRRGRCRSRRLHLDRSGLGLGGRLDGCRDGGNRRRGLFHAWGRLGRRDPCGDRGRRRSGGRGSYRRRRARGSGRRCGSRCGLRRGFRAFELCAEEVGDLRLDDAELVLRLESEPAEEAEQVLRRHAELFRELENPGFTGCHAVLQRYGARGRHPPLSHSY